MRTSLWQRCFFVHCPWSVTVCVTAQALPTGRILVVLVSRKLHKRQRRSCLLNCDIDFVGSTFARRPKLRPRLIRRYLPVIVMSELMLYSGSGFKWLLFVPFQVASCICVVGVDYDIFGVLLFCFIKWIYFYILYKSLVMLFLF